MKTVGGEPGCEGGFAAAALSAEDDGVPVLRERGGVDDQATVTDSDEARDDFGQQGLQGQVKVQAGEEEAAVRRNGESRFDGSDLKFGNRRGIGLRGAMPQMRLKGLKNLRGIRNDTQGMPAEGNQQVAHHSLKSAPCAANCAMNCGTSASICFRDSG